MTTQVAITKLEKEVEELRDDVKDIKKFLFAPLKDPEGDYKKSFVQKMLKRAESRGPFFRFENKRRFLGQVRSVKSKQNP